MAEQATSEPVSNPNKDIDKIGNAIVGFSIIGLAAALLVGIMGVPFLHFIAAPIMMILGLLMMRGLFGDNGTMAVLLIALAPAAVIVPPFFPGLAIIGPLFAAFFIVAGIAKLPGMW